VLRVVVDPGVLVSAIITPAGPPAEIVRAAREGRLELIVSPHLLAELALVLAREKFRPYLSVAEAQEYVEGLARLAANVADPEVRQPVARDPGDDYLISLAEAGGASALVSGDADLLDLGGERLRVLTPRDLLQRLPER
jgi:uncharacterized protein